MRFRTGILIASLVALSACSLSKAFKPIEITELRFENHANVAIHDVALRVGATREVVKCGVIAAKNICSTSFPVRRYQGNSVVISWTHAGSAFNSGDMVIEPGENLNSDVPVQVLVKIMPNGRLNAAMINTE